MKYPLDWSTLSGSGAKPYPPKYRILEWNLVENNTRSLFHLFFSAFYTLHLQEPIYVTIDQYQCPQGDYGSVTVKVISATAEKSSSISRSVTNWPVFFLYWFLFYLAPGEHHGCTLHWLRSSCFDTLPFCILEFLQHKPIVQTPTWNLLSMVKLPVPGVFTSSWYGHQAYQNTVPHYDKEQHIGRGGGGWNHGYKIV